MGAVRRTPPEGYRTRSTEMFFRDEQHPTNDSPELTPKLEQRTANGKRYLVARFEIKLTATP